MKLIKSSIFSIALLTIMTSFSQCSSSQKLQEKAPVTFGEVYFQRWNAGIQGGGSGINLFIPVMDTNVVLDSVYFRGKSAKLETKPQRSEERRVGKETRTHCATEAEQQCTHD